MNPKEFDKRIYKVTATTKEGALKFSAGIHFAENEKAAKAKGRAFFRVSGRDPKHYIFMAVVTTEDELKEGKVNHE